MISISKCKVPHYLEGSDFYNALSSDDTEEFSIPEGNLKLTLALADVDDLRYLMKTLHFWGASRYPDVVLMFLMSSRSEAEHKEVRSVLVECCMFPELLSWHDGLEKIQNLEPSNYWYSVSFKVDVGCIRTLIKCLASNNEALVQRAQIELKRLVNFSGLTAESIMSELHSNINCVKSIDVLSLVTQRYIADLIVCSYRKSAQAKTVFLSVLPVLLLFLHSTDDELISGVCKVLKIVCQQYFDYFIHVIVSDDVFPRLMTLLDHSNYTIQADAVYVGNDFFLTCTIFSNCNMLFFYICCFSVVCYTVYAQRQCAQTSLALHVTPVMRTILLDASRPELTRIRILVFLEGFARVLLSSHTHTNINDIPEQDLLQELMRTVFEVMQKGIKPELICSSACITVYVHSKCYDENPNSDFNKAREVFKSLGLPEQALTDPFLYGTSIKHLPL